MLTQKKEIIELVRTLIDSTCTYTALHISNEKNRLAYVRAMSRCLSTCFQATTRNDIGKMRVALLKLRTNFPREFNPRIRFISNEKKYYGLGVQQSIEIVESIYVRFEKGYSSADEYFIRSILGRTHEV